MTESNRWSGVQTEGYSGAKRNIQPFHFLEDTYTVWPGWFCLSESGVCVRLGLNRGSLIRVVADALLVNFAILLAYGVRLVVICRESQSILLPEALRLVSGEYLSTAAFLTPLASLLFFGSGFYTYGRAYRSRYKAIVVLQAVTLVYVLLGFLSYLRIGPAIPRSVWVGGWILTLAFVGGARLFNAVWAEISRREARLLRQRPDAPGRRVLVIGGAGYVGSTLVRQLLANGYAVRVFDILLYGDRAMAELCSHPRFEFVHGDFRNVESVVRSMEDMDAVVHLGAIVGDPAGDIEPEVTSEINVAATRLIAEVARGYGVRRFVFTSTCSVYGASDELLDERSLVSAISLYAKTKLDSENLLLKMMNDQFSPVILRLGTLYGLSYRPRFDLVVNLLTAKAVLEGEIVIVEGDQWRPFVHVEDAARAIARCLEAPVTSVSGQIFNVGSTKENYQLKDIASFICEAAPKTQVQFANHDGSRRNYRVSCDKIDQRLGFSPTRTVRDGIKEIKDAIERGEIRDYTAKEYNNFKFLSESAVALAKVMDPLYVR